LTIVATQALGDLGPGERGSLVFSWRWYYHVPSLVLWVLIVLLLVLTKANRHRQAWLILVPLLAVAVFWRMIARLLFMPPSVAEPFGNVVISLAASWAVIWLLGDWLARRHGAVAFSSALVAMLAVGGLSYLSVHGIGSAEDLLLWAMLHGVGSLALLLPMTLAGFCCRWEYRAGRFMAWLLLWVTIVPMLSIPVAAAFVALFESGGVAEFVGILIAAILSSLIVGVVLGVAVYLMNLPFMFLAIRCPLYRDRFLNAFRLPSSPFEERVHTPVGDAA
jgi:hypothetical protein